MIINYSDHKVIKADKSIFLAGPTPRSVDVQTWRSEAIEILEKLGFDGVVYVPELEHDNRTFNYDNQVWWEREALYNASTIVFWIPRNMQTMPALTTNVEYGYWIAKNSDKIIYGRPDNAEKNKYLDWLYQTETGNKPLNNLPEVLKKAMEMAKKKANDIDPYEVNIIKKTMKEFPEIMTLIGDIQFTPENYGAKGDKKTYGQMLFPNVNLDQLKEYDRTILSVLLYYYIKDNRYEKFVEQQTGDNKLTRETFNEIRNFMLTNFNTPEKERLLLYYMVINDLGKSQTIINALKARGIENVDHDVLLSYLFKFGMLPSLNTFSDESKKSLENVINNGINVGQYIQGECVDYSFNTVLNLSQFERTLMLAEAMLDIGGVLGHVNNQNGSLIMNQSTADNILTASNVLSSCEDKTKLFDQFLDIKAEKMQIRKNPLFRKTITRLCLMMRLYRKEDIEAVENEIIDNFRENVLLIREFNQSGYDGCKAILMYYSPALLSNTLNYYKKNNSSNPIRDTLRTCLPFMQQIMEDIRYSVRDNENGVFTVMLRDAAMTASIDPTQLSGLDLSIINDGEAVVSAKQSIEPNKK